MRARPLLFALILIAASVSITDGAKPDEQSASHVVPVKGAPTWHCCVEWGPCSKPVGGQGGHQCCKVWGDPAHRRFGG